MREDVHLNNVRSRNKNNHTEAMTGKILFSHVASGICLANLAAMFGK